MITNIMYVRPERNNINIEMHSVTIPGHRAFLTNFYFIYHFTNSLWGSRYMFKLKRCDYVYLVG